MPDQNVLKMIADNQTEIKESVTELSKAQIELTKSFTEFLISDSARHEREKFQQKEIDTLKTFKSENEYTLIRAKKAFKIIDSQWTKIFTGIIIIVLLSAGVVTVPKLISKQQVEVSK